MDYKIRRDMETGTIFVHAIGDWDRDTDNLMVQQIMRSVDESGLRKVLLDIRELRFDLSMAQIFERARDMRDQRLQHALVSSQVALVYAEGSPKLDADMRFFEITAQNRSVPYRVFTDIEEARNWLLQA